MKVTSKGQVTIPQALREQAGITAGSEVEFELEGERLYLKITKGSDRGQDIVNRMTGQGTLKMTTDEIMALLRGED